jgi:hypothetical protein
MLAIRVIVTLVNTKVALLARVCAKHALMVEIVRFLEQQTRICNLNLAGSL